MSMYQRQKHEMQKIKNLYLEPLGDPSGMNVIPCLSRDEQIRSFLFEV